MENQFGAVYLLVPDAESRSLTKRTKSMQWQNKYISSLIINKTYQILNFGPKTQWVITKTEYSKLWRQ